jgi:hypothetical protein
MTGRDSARVMGIRHCDPRAAPRQMPRDRGPDDACAKDQISLLRDQPLSKRGVFEAL